MAQFLVHKDSKREFQVVRLIKDEAGKATQITLKGPNSEFTEPYDKDRFKANGYTLVTREVEEPEPEEDEEENDDHED